MIAVGLFVERDPIEDLTSGRAGLFKGGGVYLLGVQLLACVCIIAWSASTTYILLAVRERPVVVQLEQWVLTNLSFGHGTI